MPEVHAVAVLQPKADKLEDVGVDYLRITQKPSVQADRLWPRAMAVLGEEIAAGNDERQHTWNGYQCRSAGQAMAGYRNDGIVVQVSGELAARTFRQLLPDAGNVTRLDLQATARYDTPQPDLAREAFHAIPGKRTGRGRPLGVRLIANRSGGDTVALGSRASDCYGRHYDKGVEKGSDPTGCLWRWEIEAKGDTATGWSVELLGASAPLIWIRDRVYSWFWVRGLRPGFPLRSTLYNRGYVDHPTTSGGLRGSSSR